MGAVEWTQRLEERATETSMAGRISGEGWREIWSVQIACRRAQWREIGIADRGRVAVAIAGRTSPRVGFTNAGDRPPKVVIIFRFPNRDAGVGHGGVH